MIKRIGNYFLTGALLALPITVTIFLIIFLINNIGRPVSESVFIPILNIFESNMAQTPLGMMLIDLFSTFFVLCAITTLGILSQFFLGRFLIAFLEKLITKIPGVRAVYNTVKQIVDTFSKQKKAVFQEVVLLEFPRKGLYAIGFVTSHAEGEIQSRTGELVINVFVPTTPNPTSGFLIMVPKSSATSLDMSVPEAMKLIISGGAVTPPWIEKDISKI